MDGNNRLRASQGPDPLRGTSLALLSATCPDRLSVSLKEVPMSPSPKELLRRYHQLRHILERAYAQTSWNSDRIDRIADALSETEKTLWRFSGWRWRSAR